MLDIRRKPSTYGYGEVLRGKSIIKEDRIFKKEYHYFQKIVLCKKH